MTIDPNDQIRRADQPSGNSTNYGLAAVFFLGGFGLWAAKVHVGLDVEFFFDEAWRSDLIRSDAPLERYRTHDTPIPPGWIVIMRLLEYDSIDFDEMRGLGGLLSAVFFAAVGLLAVGYLDSLASFSKGLGRLSRFAFGASFISGFVVVGLTTGTLTYLNDYYFQAGCVGLFLVLWRRASTSPGARTAFIASYFSLPLVTISGQFILPVATIWWWRDCRRRGATWQAVALPALTLAISVWLLWFGYLPQISGNLRSFWADSMIGGQTGLVGIAASQIASIGAAIAPGKGDITLITGAAILVFAIGGLAATYRQWPWPIYSIASAFGLLFAFSVLGLWPSFMTRVNLPLFWMVYFYALVGVYFLALRFTVPFLQKTVIWTGFIAAILVVTTHTYAAPDPRMPFARGLYGDLGHVTTSETTRNIVISYHFMSHFYAYDRLENDPDTSLVFHIVRELSGDRTLYTDLPRVIADIGWDNATIWCVIPFEVGGENTDQACQIDDPNYRFGGQVNGQHSVLRWHVPTSVYLSR